MPSFIIAGYVTDFRDRGRFCHPSHPIREQNRKSLNRVKSSYLSFDRRFFNVIIKSRNFYNTVIFQVIAEVFFKVILVKRAIILRKLCFCVFLKQLNFQSRYDQTVMIGNSNFNNVSVLKNFFLVLLKSDLCKLKLQTEYKLDSLSNIRHQM